MINIDEIRNKALGFRNLLEGGNGDQRIDLREYVLDVECLLGLVGEVVPVEDQATCPFPEWCEDNYASWYACGLNPQRRCCGTDDDCPLRKNSITVRLNNE